jgi:hypothetical protein
MKANEQTKKGKRESVQRSKGKWKRFALLQSLGHQSWQKRKETMTAVSSGRVYQPVDYQPPTRRRLPTRPVLHYGPDPSFDFPPHPSSIADPTRPRLPTRPVLDHPFDPSLIYRTDRSTITDPHPWFYPARVFQNFYFCVGRVCRSCPGVNQGINKSIMCPDRRAMVNNKKNLVIPYLGRPCFSYYTCNALT